MSNSEQIRPIQGRPTRAAVRLWLTACLFLGELFAAAASAASFGLTETPQAFTVDTGAGLVFQIRRQDRDGSARGAGDIIGMTYRGEPFQDARKGSQINSGFADLYDGQSGVTVQAAQVDADHIKITVTAGDLVHYYLAERGQPVIFMATYFRREPKPNLVRFVARIPHERLPDGPPAADVSQAVRLVEAHDVFALADGQTRSKHYSNQRLKDWWYFGARGPGVGVWMVRDDNEGGSGGPFYRSLLDQGNAIDQELTYIVNYGEVQTEPFRLDILDRYALVFTRGEPPPRLDTGWFARMGLEGYVPPAARGGVAGVGLSGMQAGVPYTVGFANAHAQYWTTASVDSGAFARSDMLPGTYRLTVYRNELAVASEDVTVKAGATTPLHSIRLDGDPTRTPVLWRIGHWDGTPQEFRNGERMTFMHPSDVRQASWTTAPFIVGQSSSQDFPACQWADVNNPLRIRFRLTQAQRGPLTLRVGITIAFANARPTIEVNDWVGPVPPPSVQPSSRSLTVGSYRGNNQTFTFDIPATALKVGDNELRLKVVSGKGGSGFLSPGVAYDALDLLGAH